MGKGIAFGKTIFIGDQFVLREVPAILAALPFVTEAVVERTDGGGWTLEDNRLEVPGYKEKKKHQQVDSINHILEVMQIDVQKTPIKITYGGDLLAGSGVGASAASCVSLARALNDEFNLNYSIEQINNVGWEGEFAYHGIPSGVDNTASTYGGLIRYWIKDEEKHFEQIKLEKPIRLVLGNSGITADTSKMDIYTDRELERDPDLFNSRLDTIRRQGEEMKTAFETDDHKKVGEIMTANHKILIDMDLSHEILVDLCDRAISMGAFGAKVTGGGRGGYMSAIVPDRETQEKLAASFIADGYQTIQAEIRGK
jgi:mevalonate kinase